MATRVLRGAGVQAADLAAIVLVGGCCRMPIVRDLLQKEFERPLALGTHPEYDVAIGLLLTPQPGGVTSGAAGSPAGDRRASRGRVPPEPVDTDPDPRPTGETPAARWSKRSPSRRGRAGDRRRADAEAPTADAAPEPTARHPSRSARAERRHSRKRRRSRSSHPRTQR